MKVNKEVDVLIVGAGISGIDAAFRLQQRCPGKSFAILESRARIGGTWDLFRFPGVRSDSDMYTLGFPFRPWRGPQAIVGGEAIRQYVEDTAREFGIFDKIRFNTHVATARWSSADARWTVETDHGAFSCRFLYLASGYYDYAAGHQPEWPGEADFKGHIVHPQFWPEDLDYSGKRVAVIGSGATAVTLVPAMADQAASVTMVQRSPSYIVAAPARDSMAKWLPAALIRWKHILMTISMFGRARRAPQRVAEWIRDKAREALPAGYPVERDFSPRYDPWDQRLCLIPDGDLFASISGGKAAIATGEIERFVPQGLRLKSGETIRADVVVTATGLNMRLLGGIELEVDGEAVRPAEHFIYKGMMLSGVPNLFVAFGYTNASWTLRADLTARSVCRLLNLMDRKGFTTSIAHQPANLERRSIMELSSGYVERAAETLPGQGDRQPWRVPQHYVKDLAAMTFGRIDEGLEFGPTAS
ncbi:flavin-containing monooxygenase [Sphingomonas sp.]|uniref:flavin-containing monooxygenase n=1 Tax=Sphingomonas sp. TaxID=28214 RepID=UPI00389E5CC7